MDPRGLGQSTPMNYSQDVSRCAKWPKTETVFEANAKCIRELTERCYHNANGAVVKYTDTLSIVWDVEALRVALNEDKLSLMGASCGTNLVATYLDLFRGHVRAMVMDGVVDHTVWSFEQFRAIHAGMQKAFDGFTAGCNSNETCLFHDQNIRQVAEEVIDKAKDNAGCLTDHVSLLESARKEWENCNILCQGPLYAEILAHEV